jgi:acetylornithine deacetylase/succinyl-diaminopimelate desuccinylase-like protein
MASVVRELESLEGFTLTSLLARIKGDRNARIQETRERWSEIEKKLGDTAEAVEALRRGVDEIEKNRSAETPVRSLVEEERAGNGGEAAPVKGAEALGAVGRAPEPRSTDEQAKAIGRVIKLCEDCRKGLSAEIETAGRLGKCKVVAANAVISGLLQATTNRARQELGQRVRDDLRRLSGRFEEVIAAGPPSVLAEESEARAKLAHYAEHFDGRWLVSNAPGGETTDAVFQTLCLVEMLLEKRLNDSARQ